MFRAQYTPGDDNIRPLTGLVESLVSAKRSDEAIRLLQADLAKAPGRAPVQYILAEVYASAGRPESAIPVLEQITAAHPESVQAMLALGQLRQNTGKLDAAIADFQKARAAAPNNAQAVILQAQAEGMAGKFDQAKQDYQAALKIDPSNILALNNLAYLDADTGANLDEAMRLITTASQKVPKQPNLTDTLGYVYLKQKKFDNAVRVFETLAQQYPTNPTYLFHHGLALLESGSKTMAKKELEAALAAKPNAALATKIKEALSRAG
jgi:tetratricopeptide (TPR) repeat protein